MSQSVGWVHMTDGEKMLKLAETRIGEKYVNVCIPKNNPNWHGPCVNDSGDPATVEAYTGAWQTDSRRLGKRVPKAQAAATPGAILLRYPPSKGAMGHIVVSDGKGGTVEAMGRAYGVRRGKVSGRVWDTGVFLPDFSYGDADVGLSVKEPTVIYAVGRPDMKTSVIKSIQRALKEFGIDPGPINGEYSQLLATAVGAFQATKGIIVDGQVGPQTARRLKIDLSGA